MTTLDILLVDDDADIRAIAVMSLRLDAAITVTAAGSAAEAMRPIAAGWVPDAVLLDVMMPGIDGLTFLRSLREMPRMRRCPIILLTATVVEEIRAQCRADSACAVILKPFDPITLASDVRRAVAKIVATEADEP